jgi:glycerate dehydrogenase
MRTVFLDTEGLNDLVLDELKDECGSCRMFSATTPAETEERIAEAELVILNKVKISRRHLERAPSVKLICVVATGTDIIDLQAASDLGIVVCNCQAYGTDSVAQHVFASMLALATSLLAYHDDVRKGEWQKARQFCLLTHPIIELKGKTLGIVGFGSNGRRVAEIAEIFGMKVLLARRPGQTDGDRPELKDILPEVDFLTLHCPLTPETKNLINSDTLALMKPTAFLINAARGGIVDEEALLVSLQTGALAGAAIDVLSAEPPRDSNPLLEAKLPNLIITPHCAWASREARQRIIDQTVENIRAFKDGRPIRTVP